MKKLVISLIAFVTLGGVLLPTANVFASEQIEETEQSITEELGLTDSQILQILSGQESGITLDQGRAFDKDGNELFVAQRGKFSWAVRAIKAAWNKLPSGVKKAIGGAAGLSTLLNVIDNFTGKVEDAVYAGCKALGMNGTVAWWVTKALMLFL
ncbi:hypothetical protein [Isobaculum melis]|uniref:Uncharacterized protein n=1 Tax=Isobaculum melis TaxID=142588 RepID=A0A1H9U2V4_9LACT|nr:hypothetical protein [Isobaculum melis]SES03504.1 hypothetical protein SAMN04488559_12024 [Isobaculum melis]